MGPDNLMDVTRYILKLRHCRGVGRGGAEEAASPPPHQKKRKEKGKGREREGERERERKKKEKRVIKRERKLSQSFLEHVVMGL